MARILHVARMREGQEAELRGYLESRWPEVDFSDAGLVEVNVFIGSGYCATLYEYEGDFKPVFRKLSASASAQRFFSGLAHLLEDFPFPLPEETAQVPLAGDAFRWPERPETADYRTVPGHITTRDREHNR
jgi:hypothetical protein